MGLHEALFTRLSGFAGLTALIGAGSSCKAWPDEAPKNPAAPYVVFFQVGASRTPLSGADSTVRRSRVQFDCYGDTGDSARAVAAQVVAAIARLQGSYGGTVIQDAYIENEISGVDDDTRLKVVSVDADIVYVGS